MRREGSAESGQVGGEWWVQGLGVLEGGFPREEATGFVRNLMQRGHFSGAVTVFLGGRERQSSNDEEHGPGQTR